MNSVISNGYKIEFKGRLGNFQDCVAVFRITHPNGKVVEDSRMGSTSKKGVMRTSIYGIKIKVNLNTGELELAQ